MAQPIAPPTRSTSALDILKIIVRLTGRPADLFFQWVYLGNPPKSSHVSEAKSFCILWPVRGKRNKLVGRLLLWSIFLLWRPFARSGRRRRKKLIRLFSFLTTNYSMWNHPWIFSCLVWEPIQDQKWKILSGHHYERSDSWDSWTI